MNSLALNDLIAILIVALILHILHILRTRYHAAYAQVPNAIAMMT